MAKTRRRWIDVLRRTAGVSEGDRTRGATPAEETVLWEAHQAASSAMQDSLPIAERLAGVFARQRLAVSGVSERGTALIARLHSLETMSARFSETFDRLGIVALNAGLEGARLSESQGRQLLLVSEELRLQVDRGLEIGRELTTLTGELNQELSSINNELAKTLEEAREVGGESGKLLQRVNDATKAMLELGQKLRRLTGMDPEIARAVSLASEHARGLMNALSVLSTTDSTAVPGALRPFVSPLVRLLAEIGLDEGEVESGETAEGQG